MILLWLACTRAPSPDCPADHAPDPARESAIREAAGAHLPDDIALCFGPSDPSVAQAESRTLYLDHRLGTDEAAARAAHLALHVTEPIAFTGADCDAEVAAALLAEGAAYDLELQLRDRLGVTDPRVRYGFEPAWRAATPADRPAEIAAHLAANPDGGPGFDALAAGYRARCEDASGR